MALKETAFVGFMIEGIGVDLVSIPRIQAALERTPSMRQRIFTEREGLLPIASLAARFAAKEALYKAIDKLDKSDKSDGRSLAISWQDAEVVNEESGRPEFIFYRDLASLLHDFRVHLSLSHDGQVAVAYVVIER